MRWTLTGLPKPWSPSASTRVCDAAPRTMLNESSISANEIRSRSGPPRRLAATQEPDRNAVSKPAVADSLALSPSHGRHDDEAGLGQEGAKAIGRAHAHEIGLSECHAVRGRAAQRILVGRLPRAPLPSKS